MNIVKAQRVKDWLVYFFVRVAFCIIQALRIETCEMVSNWLAFLACDVFKLRGEVVDENIKHSFPHLSASQRHTLARRTWEHLILMVCEIAHVQRKLHDTNWRNYVVFRGKPELLKYLLDPRPRVLVSGHFGNFEIASYLAGAFGFHTYAVARTLDNPFLHNFVTRFRESKGQYILSKDGSASLIADVLNSGGTLSILGDQHAGPKGCWVNFLGRPASYHKAVALFTLSSGAPMLVITCKRIHGLPLRFEFGVEGITDPAHLPDKLASVSGLTEWYNQMLEQAVYSAPEQYWWVHRRWREAPPPRRKTKPPPVVAEQQQRPAA